MLKRHQIENIFPLAATVISLYIFIMRYDLSVFYFLFFSITVIGCLIWWLGVISLGEAFSTLPKTKKLVKRGIYSKIRHPIYVGLSLVLIGWCHVINSVVFFIIVFIVILILAMRAHFEEKKLKKEFGEEYSEYEKETWF